MNRKNILFAIIALIVLGGVVVIALVLGVSPSQNENVNTPQNENDNSRRTYISNAVPSLTFLYPDGWTVTESQSSDFIQVTSTETQTPPVSVIFSVEPSMNRTLSDWIASKVVDAQVVSRTTVNVTGVSAERIVQATSDHTSSISYLFSRDGNLYDYYGVVEVASLASEFSALEQTVDQIIQSAQIQ